MYPRKSIYLSFVFVAFSGLLALVIVASSYWAKSRWTDNPANKTQKSIQALRPALDLTPSQAAQLQVLFQKYNEARADLSRQRTQLSERFYLGWGSVSDKELKIRMAAIDSNLLELNKIGIDEVREFKNVLSREQMVKFGQVMAKAAHRSEK